MATANQVYFDAALRHQIGVRRFAAGEAKRVVSLLEAADRELVEKLRSRLARVGTATVTDRRVQALLTDVRALRQTTLQSINATSRENLFGLSQTETEFETQMLKEAIPIDVSFAAVDATQIRKIVTSRPFQGRLLRDWYGGLEAADRSGLSQAIKLGLTQGESIPNIVRRVAGTRAAGFRDGVLAITRRNAEAVIRTAVNHVSNAAREEVWDANLDIIAALRWTATLDGRTSPICQARDGKLIRVAGKPLPEGGEPLEPQGARPPAHIGCRSIIVSVIDGEGVVGDRPFVRDTRTPARRETDFRKIARETGKPIKQVRKEWADENIGRVPAKTTYDEWLRKQPKNFQDQVLGKGKAGLFRKGQKLDKFVDRRGNELSLKELQKQVKEIRPERIKPPSVSKKVTISPSSAEAKEARQKILELVDPNRPVRQKIAALEKQKQVLFKKYSTAEDAAWDARQAVRKGTGSKAAVDAAEAASAKALKISTDFGKKLDGLLDQTRKELLNSLQLDPKLRGTTKGVAPSKLPKGMQGQKDLLNTTAKKGFDTFNKYVTKDLMSGDVQYLTQDGIERAFANRRFVPGGTITIRPDDRIEVVLHELGHVLEWRNPRVGKAARDFLKVRAAKDPRGLRKLTEIVPSKGFGIEEKAWEDKFMDPYMGKHYKDGSTEIVSMGVEMFFNRPVSFAKADPEMFEFIYDLLRGTL